MEFYLGLITLAVRRLGLKRHYKRTGGCFRDRLQA
jgi:hypothetical protein